MARAGRRGFLKSSIGTVAGVTLSRRASAAQETTAAAPAPAKPPRIRFAAIGLNHDHINGQVGALLRGGGELVAVFAKEPELVAAFTKRFPQARVAPSEREILEDPKIQLVASAAIASERAPLGIEVMRHGKDF